MMGPSPFESLDLKSAVYDKVEFERADELQRNGETQDLDTILKGIVFQSFTDRGLDLSVLPEFDPEFLTHYFQTLFTTLQSIYTGTKLEDEELEVELVEVFKNARTFLIELYDGVEKIERKVDGLIVQAWSSTKSNAEAMGGTAPSNNRGDPLDLLASYCADLIIEVNNYFR